jgi:hypothetical protein
MRLPQLIPIPLLFLCLIQLWLDVAIASGSDEANVASAADKGKGISGGGEGNEYDQWGKKVPGTGGQTIQLTLEDSLKEGHKAVMGINELYKIG